MRPRSGTASAILAGAALVATLVTAPTTVAQVDPASRAIQYLVAHQARDGSLDGSVGETEDLVLGAAANGYDPASLRSSAGRSPYDFLSASIGPATADAGKTAKLILALVAGGRDPRAFAGRDLVAGLEARYDPATGRFGDGATFTQALSILALVGAAAPDAPVPAAAVDALVAVQDSDGSWNYLGSKDAAAGGDTNSTAIAVMGLIAAGRAPTSAPLVAATAFLHGTQQSDGGFPYQAGSGAVSDPDSDALVLEALDALGIDPFGPAWLAGGHSAVANLRGFQDQASGGFTFPGNAAPDTFTTSEVPQGLARIALPFTGRFGAGIGPSTASGRAVGALTYLVGHLAVDGSLDGSAGETEDLLLGAAAAGFDPSTVATCAGRTAYAYLAAHIGAATATPGATAKLILALVAGHWNPGSFAGHDLIGELTGAIDPPTGRVGDGSTFGQALAILALAAAGQQIPPAAVSALDALQDTDGSWNYQAAANATAGDTNSTAIALTALAAAGDRSRVAAGLGWLHGQQVASGGFPYQAGAGAVSDPDSDALVLEALVATGVSPADPAWSIGGRTGVTDLLSLQAANGGYAFPGNPAPDAFTTSQVPMALERVPYGTPVRWTPGRSIPGQACPASSGGGGSTLPPTTTAADGSTTGGSGGTGGAGTGGGGIAALGVAAVAAAWLVRRRRPGPV